MTKIALTAVAILVATGSTFAASDHYGSNNAGPRSAVVDHALTASVRNSVAPKYNGVNVSVEPGQAVTDAMARHSNDGIWGR
jgi:hypothetical protein